MLKRNHLKLLSCVLVLAMTLSAFSGAAAFAEESAQSRTETGDGTPESPRLTADSSAVTDPVTGETTITVSFDKEWSDEGTSGEEHGKTSETQDEAGNLTSAEGEAEGRETTVKGSADGGTAEIKTDNGSGKTVDGTPDIKTEVPDLTVELTPGGSAESSEAADAWLDEGTIDIPDWVKADDTWISEDSTSEDNGVITKVQVSIDAQTNTTTYTRTVYGTDGQQTTETVAYTRDKEGRITGYSTLKATTTSATTEDSAPPENAEINPNGGWTSLDYEPPEKPTPANEPVYDADGKILSGDLVSEIYDDEGKLTGYTVITFENGKPVAYSNPVFGQYVATTTKVETLPDGKQLITKSRTKVISAESRGSSCSVSGSERRLSAWMGKITGSTDIDYSKTFRTFFPSLRNDGSGTTDTERDLYNRRYELTDYDSSAEFFQWLGEYGIESAFRVKAGGASTWQPHQFVLQGADGSKYYVYCADFDVSPRKGAQYNMERLEDADYYANNEDGEAADRIRAIVLNGYWGVENSSTDPESPTPGSLDAFKKMLTDAGQLTKEQAAQLSDGMALTATQAAIWYFGNSGSTALDVSDIVGRYCSGSKFDEVSSADKALINGIYRYLIGMPGQEADINNTLLTKDDFAKDMSLTVGERNDAGQYETDITISMAVIPDSTSSDLIVTVFANGVAAGSYRLCGGSSRDSENGIRAVTSNPDGSYTLSGLLLSANTTVTLNLNGTQNIENGVYLFTCVKNNQSSQTFIGAGSAQQDVDLSVDFSFNVDDPTVKLSSSSSEGENSETHWTGKYYTVTLPGVGEDVGSGRNEDIPKTGDSLPLIQAILAAGITVSACLSGAAIVLCRREPEAF